MESWKPVSGFEGRYEVSDAGHVRSLLRRKVMLKPGRGSSDGRPIVFLYAGGAASKRYVHDLVAQEFIGPKPPGHVVRHKDDDPWNNAASNLLYGTPAQNNQDMIDRLRHGMAKKAHCSKGHRYTPETSYWNGRQRVCRRCRADRVAEWNERNPEYKAAAKLKNRQRRGVARAALTQCSNGHEYTPENTIRTKNGTRKCRECKNAAARRARATKKERTNHQAAP